jgi:glycosyltransferase involved in cell wall biosynthesis
MFRFLQHLDKSRIEAVVTFVGDGSFEREVAELGFRTYAVPAARVRQLYKALGTIRGLAQILRREHPDLILSWGAKAQILAAPAALRTRLGDRLIWWQTEMPSGAASARLATLLPAVAVACVTNYVADGQRRRRPRRNTFVVYPGIEPPRQASSDELDELRTSLSIPAGRKVIGTVGRLEERKRQDLLIVALAYLRRQGHDVHGVLVGGDAWDGDPTYGLELRKMVDDLDLTEAVTFTGHVSDTTPYIQLLDVYAHTCLTEASGNAVIEAMGSGVACVAVGTAGPAELIGDEAGLVVAQPDGTLLGQALERLLDDEELRRTFAAAGMERQRQVFSAEGMTEQLEDRLSELASGAELK